MGSGVEPAFLKAISLGQMCWNRWGMLVKDTTSVPLLRPLASEPPHPRSWVLGVSAHYKDHIRI